MTDLDVDDRRVAPEPRRQIDATNFHYIVDELRALREEAAVSRMAMANRVDAVEVRVRHIESGIADNTAMLGEVREAIVTAKLAHKVFKWVTGTIVAVSAAWYAFKDFLAGLMK